MDLLQTVRKEGSRGGVNFSWDDVKSSNHRENYLGHSLMAPVGRWQKGKDLNWYAKAEDAELTPEERKEKEELERKEERRKIKEAEEDAMATALGLPVPDRSNANMEPLGLSKGAGKALKEALADDSDGGNAAEAGKQGPGKGDRREPQRDSERHDERTKIVRGGTSTDIVNGRGRDQKIGESDREVETGRGETTGRDETETRVTTGEIDLGTTAVDEAAEADRARHIADVATLMSDESRLYHAQAKGLMKKDAL